MTKEENALIFQETQIYYESIPTLISSVSNSIQNQKLIKEEDDYSCKSKYNLGKVVVSQKRTFEAAKAYVDKGYKVAVLNFASATRPGGGVVKGSFAQEECLCRASTLYGCLSDRWMQVEFYAKHRYPANPLNNDDIIYTPNVTVFREDTDVYEILPDADWWNVNVITCAAPNLRDNPSNPYNPANGNNKVDISKEDLLKLHVKRFSRILEVATNEGNEVIILGAFGCGAFANPPTVVAKAAIMALNKYRRNFNTIEFAVYCGADKTNYEVFKQIH